MCIDSRFNGWFIAHLEVDHYNSLQFNWWAKCVNGIITLFYECFIVAEKFFAALDTINVRISCFAF